MKKWWLVPVLLVVALMASMMPACGPAAPAAKTTLFMGVNPVGSLYHTAGTALADIASKYSGIEMRIRPLSGPHIWVGEMSRARTLELGLIDAYDAWMAYNGKQSPFSPPPPDIEYEGPLRYEGDDSIRALRIAFDIIIDASVRADSGIKTHDQMRGKRITWEFSGFSPGITIARTMLAYGGLRLEDVVPVPVSDLPGAIDALIEGRVDMYTVGVGSGKASEAHARIPGGIYALPASDDPERRAAAKAVYPGLVIRTFPGGILDGIPETDEFSIVPAYIMSSTETMSDDTAYNLIKTWWEHDEELTPMFRLFGSLTTDKYVSPDITIPYHPGAIKWYKEKGIWTAEMETVQKRLLDGEYPFLD